MEKPSRGGKKRTAVWASHHEERGSDGAVSPPMCDHRVALHRCVVREWCNPPGSTVATCLNAAARTLRAARAVKGDILSVWQVLHGTPSAPPIPAQRVARFDDHCTRNCLLKNKLRQRYSRSIHYCNQHARLLNQKMWQWTECSRDTMSRVKDVYDYIGTREFQILETRCDVCEAFDQQTLQKHFETLDPWQ